MPDITMCPGTVKERSCPNKEQCYRYTAKPSEYLQSYFIDLPMNSNKECGHFWDNRPYTKKKDHHNKNA